MSRGRRPKKWGKPVLRKPNWVVLEFSALLDFDGSVIHPAFERRYDLTKERDKKRYEEAKKCRDKQDAEWASRTPDL